MGGAGAPEAPPVATGGLIALADRLGHVMVVDHEGRRRWSADGNAAVVRGGPAFAGAAVVLPLDDGRLLVASQHGQAVTDPPGRVSGVAASATGVVYATREADTNALVWARTKRR
jgi:hypothetical protein